MRPGSLVRYLGYGTPSINSWVLEWMTEKVTCSVEHFLAVLNFPRFEFDEPREHRLHFWETTEVELHLLMDPELVGDASTEVNPKNLAYENKVMFYILCNSLTPTNRPETIGGIVGNVLHAISVGIRFDLPDLHSEPFICS